MTQGMRCATEISSMLNTDFRIVISIVPTLMWLQVRLGLSQYDAATRRAATSGPGANSVPGPLVFLRANTQKETTFHTTHHDVADLTEKELDATKGPRRVTLQDAASSVPSESTMSV